ncbi:MAG: glycosyltransferase [Taibaiella sp.]|nr:glycosyltransferase [Taibaiella sp.]
MFVLFLYWLFVFSISIQCLYALYFFIRLFFIPETPIADIDVTKGASVIICARNEAHNLLNNLPLILAQRYSNDPANTAYEVIVVNDASSDDTSNILANLQTAHRHLNVINISPEEKITTPGKKHALAKAVATAAYEWLVFTDADCVPSGNEWLALMTAPLYAGKEIVAGYGRYKRTGGLLNKFTRWESLHTFLQYSSYAYAGMPYMAVGRNLACTKNIWLSGHQSGIWKTLPSGDDDMLMRAMATGSNTAIVADQQAHTITIGKESWKEWMKQKQRHLSTGKYYKPFIKALLSMYASTHAAMWLLFIYFLFIPSPHSIFWYFSLRCVLYWGIWICTARKLNEKKLTIFFPLFDIGWMLYNFAFSPYIILKNKQQWT